MNYAVLECVSMSDRSTITSFARRIWGRTVYGESDDRHAEVEMSQLIRAKQARH